ncbi:hydrolase [Sinimarinibacterium sp. NLF-5-8]|uniref:hydrolase n=1 Tax=Sinimarinibacterium sp. NLF-5-8 TaxID=2698684 RepID=UPI00137C1A7E|nr:hydrolase [Sinimarinibacterium sp. NLF-5-8]QHS11167.1 hydrolase [Sinimarinibacterium sp. NLF-5-8]
MNIERLDHGRVIDSTFEPHPWLRGPHAQTLVPSLLRPLPKLAIRYQRLELPDGDFVDLGWSGDENAARIAVLVHGLTGGFESKYLRGTAQQLIARGWQVVMIQLRGGGEPNRRVRCYHHGDTADLRYLWHWLAQHYPRAQLAAAGWSLGANVVLKALGEEGDDAPVVAAAAGCAPFELETCANKMRHGSARLYQNHLLGGLKKMVKRKHAVTPLPARLPLQNVLKAKDFFEFDNAFTAPLNGFKDAQDYYARAQCLRYLNQIARPTLIVNARDDPFMTPTMLPGAEQLSPFVTLEVAQRGGHVGFMSAGHGRRPRFWLESHFAEFLDQQVAAGSSD